MPRCSKPPASMRAAHTGSAELVAHLGRAGIDALTVVNRTRERADHLAEEITRIVAIAKEGKLQPTDYTDGTRFVGAYRGLFELLLEIRDLTVSSALRGDFTAAHVDGELQSLATRIYAMAGGSS